MKKFIKTILFFSLFSCGSRSSNSSLLRKAQTQDTIQETHTIKVAPSLSYYTYCNSRFDYCIDYPKDIIYPQPESANGDGRIFIDKQGQEILRVFGRNNSDPEFGNITLEQQFHTDLHDIEKQTDHQVITYQKLGNDFFIISGYNKDRFFYQKTILKDGALGYAMLQYEKRDKATFDKISERIFKSFKWRAIPLTSAIGLTSISSAFIRLSSAVPG